MKPAPLFPRFDPHLALTPGPRLGTAYRAQLPGHRLTIIIQTPRPHLLAGIRATVQTIGAECAERPGTHGARAVPPSFAFNMRLLFRLPFLDNRSDAS